MSQAAKTILRATLLDRRRWIDPAARLLWDAALCGRVLDWWKVHPVSPLGIYWPMRGEPDLRPAYEALAAAGAQLALPVTARSDEPLCFAQWMPGDVLVKDGMGVSVPLNAQKIIPGALLIPCVGFNAGRFRLGYGGGFYDRTLALPSRPLAIGIAYSCLEAQFDSDPHDVAMDQIITEK